MPLLGWTLNLIYAALLAVLSPVLVWRGLTQGKHRSGWREKLLGLLPERGEHTGPLIWFHAVSVGEVLLLQPLVQRLREARTDVRILVTTTTETGHAVARDKLPGCTISWLPLDFTWAVRRAVRRVRPDLFVLVELELWPNLIHAVTEAGVPLALVNGRLSERSFRGYRRIRWLVSRLLARFDSINVQTEEYARRFVALGAASATVHVTGSIKFDGVETDRHNPRTESLRRALGINDDERVFIAGSTQAPEEESALRTWLALREEFPDLRLILVPRHRERFEEVASLVRSVAEAASFSRHVVTSSRETREKSPRFTLLRRSETLGDSAKALTPGPSPGGRGEISCDKPVILLDTLGELSACWGLADIAFVGGSLNPKRGGQNMIEPAAFGAAVLFGPHTQNFRAVVESLLAADAALVVRDGEELADTVRRLLRDPLEAVRRGTNASRIVLTQQGATQRTIERLLQTLSHGDPARRAA